LKSKNRKPAAEKLPAAAPVPDERWMRKALVLAGQGLGRTSPNPSVGALLVKDDVLLSQGWHQQAGLPHAEIEAFSALSNPGAAAGATLYVTLEPCSSQGRTPPCTEAIIRAGCTRVVYGATDPDSRHQGRARNLLEAAGIEVTEGILEKECMDLNRAWNYWIRTKMPWVILKAGQSLDGRLTPPPPERAVTSAEARQDVMKLRSQCDAILVGGQTLRSDLPQLNVRGMDNAPQPRRIVWTRTQENLPAGAPMFCDEDAGRSFVVTHPTFQQLCQSLGERGIVSLLVEGGGQVHGAVVDSGLVNEVVLYTAPVIFGGGVPTTCGRGADDNDGGLHLEIKEAAKVGADLKIRALVSKIE
jgi:diaminohydroxyphosphoribosylaminopyrimidine deaminase/5-amino-6-(5-phosphoribosylamino)uracil reductase